MLTRYKLIKPSLSSINEANLNKRFHAHSDSYMESIYAVCEPIYYFWDRIQYSSHLPKNLKPEEFWNIVKIVRKYSSRKISVMTEKGEYFSWLRLSYTDEFLHKLDMQLGTSELHLLSRTSLDTEQKKKYLTKSIMEEAIASSQLEGAATTTSMAKKLLTEKRTPKDRSERMIVNNYKTMQALNQEYKDKKLSKEIVFELHRLITKDTLEVSKQGRYRKDSEDVTVNDQLKYIYYVPPKEEFVSKEMER